MKCNTCKQQYSLECDYRQGRCPGHKPVVPIWLIILAAPVIIGAWAITNPRQIWQQAKKEWNIK
jgi:hypothetical protein